MNSSDKRTKKTYLTIGLAAFLVLALAGGITYAWLIASAAKENTFVTGEVKSEVQEENYVPPEELTPGTEFDKDPKVINTGTLECFVRMKVVYTVPAANDWCTLTGLAGTGWEDGGDGWYYYNGILEPGDETTALFTGVKIADNAAASELEAFEILVYSEAVEHPQHDTCPANEYRNIWQDYQ